MDFQGHSHSNHFKKMLWLFDCMHLEWISYGMLNTSMITSHSHFTGYEIASNTKTGGPGFHVLIVISYEPTVRMPRFLAGGQV